VLWFHSVWETACTFIYSPQKGLLSLHQLDKIHTCSETLCANLLDWISPRTNNKCGKYRDKFFMLVGQVWLFLHWYSWSLFPITNFLCMYIIYWMVSKFSEKWRKHEWIFIYLHNKCTGLPAPIFMKLKFAEQFYVQISYSKFTKIIL
jgi:hypothetical protein